MRCCTDGGEAPGLRGGVGRNHAYPEEAKTMQSLTTRMREEGERIGEQRGIQIGEAHMLLFQLEQKFGIVPEALRTRVQKADPDTLLRWSGRVLTEDSVEDVLQ
jgi:hypothetical protein